MTFIISCFFYSLVGCSIGLFAHIFNGLIQVEIQFNWSFVMRTISHFGKILGAMTLTTIVIGLAVLAVPNSFMIFLQRDLIFFHNLVYYIFGFAAFGLGMKDYK